MPEAPPMFDNLKDTTLLAALYFSARRVLFLAGLSLVLTACGGLADVSGTNATTTISWAPMTVNGDNAEEYRVLYSRSGERPKEVITTLCLLMSLAKPLVSLYRQSAQSAAHRRSESSLLDYSQCGPRVVRGPF